MSYQSRWKLMPPRGFVPELDGLRGLAILMVMIAPAVASHRRLARYNRSRRSAGSASIYSS